MFRMRLLGGFELHLPDGSPAGRLGPKPQALLAFLGMNRAGAVARGRLAGLLWGERDEELARHSLCQALTTIRGALGPGAADLLQARAEGIQLARGELELDVDVFESAARSHDRAGLQEICRLYRGDFLEGLDIREPDFEDWLLDERYRLRNLGADAFARLLDLQTEAGEAEAAIETARKLVALTPLDEAIHARLIRLYGQLGRRGLAEAQYARCAELLERELGQAPEAELKAALAEARRASAKVGAIAYGPPAIDQPPSAPRTLFATGPGRRWAWVAVAAGMVLLISAASWTARHLGEVGEARSYEAAPWDLPSEPSIAVLPFTNLSNDPEQSYFVDGITTDIITDLSRFSRLFVIAPSSTFRYQGRSAKVQDVARDLGVRYVLEGSVRRAGSLRINVSLTDATTGWQVWAERYERRTDDVLAAQKEIAQKVAAVVGSGHGEIQRAELERIARIPTRDLEAYDLYLRGVAYKSPKTRENNARARQMFEKAIQADPTYARVIAECSLTHVNDVFNQWTDAPEASLQAADGLARRAIEIDPSEPWGWVALGLVHQLKAQSQLALSRFEAAHALNPNDYDVKQALGLALAYAGSVERGIELMERAERLNPRGTGEPSHLAMAYFFAGRYEDALGAINRVASRENSPTYWQYKAAIYAQLGQMAEARAAVAEALSLDPGLTVQGEHQRRLTLGLAPAHAEHLSAALRKAGLPERNAAQIGEAGQAL